jgi:hypothetical protein
MRKDHVTSIKIKCTQQVEILFFIHRNQLQLPNDDVADLD